MARAYAEDLRRRVVQDGAASASRPAVAAWDRVSVSFVAKLVRLELVRWLLAETPNFMVEELRARLAEADVPVGRSSVGRRRTAPAA